MPLGELVPPRVREVKRLLRKSGYTVVRPGKGDHTIFLNPTTGDSYALDGSDSHEMPQGAWNKLKKRLGLK
jgi:predicted RNA binding protein YcfA (HicA-like mRNA interferase family)